MNYPTLTVISGAVAIHLGVVSLIVSLLVACKMMRLPRNLRQRTTPRLMMWLALSDVCAHALWIVMSSLSFVGVWQPISMTIVRRAVNAFFVYSYWLEVAHAVAHLLCSIRRGLCILPRLSGLAVAMATAINACVVWNSLHGDWKLMWIIFYVSAIMASLLSCASLVVVAGRATRSGETAERRQRRNAAVWIANALMTNMVYGITGLAALFWPQHRDPLVFLCFVLVSAKGALNGCAIFYSSRYSSEAIQDVARLENPDSCSYHVDLTGKVEIIPVP